LDIFSTWTRVGSISPSRSWHGFASNCVTRMLLMLIWIPNASKWMVLLSVCRVLQRSCSSWQRSTIDVAVLYSRLRLWMMIRLCFVVGWDIFRQFRMCICVFRSFSWTCSKLSNDLSLSPLQYLHFVRSGLWGIEISRTEDDNDGDGDPLCSEIFVVANNFLAAFIFDLRWSSNTCHTPFLLRVSVAASICPKSMTLCFTSVCIDFVFICTTCLKYWRLTISIMYTLDVGAGMGTALIACEEARWKPAIFTNMRIDTKCDGNNDLLQWWWDWWDQTELCAQALERIHTWGWRSIQLYIAQQCKDGYSFLTSPQPTWFSVRAEWT